MFQQRVAQNVASRREAHQHLQVAAEAARHALHGSAEVVALRVVHIIYNIGDVLALGIFLADGVHVGQLHLAATHHALDAVLQRLGLLLGYGCLGDVVDRSQGSACDDGHAGKYQHHVGD